MFMVWYEIEKKDTELSVYCDYNLVNQFVHVGQAKW